MGDENTIREKEGKKKELGVLQCGDPTGIVTVWPGYRFPNDPRNIRNEDPRGGKEELGQKEKGGFLPSCTTIRLCLLPTRCYVSTQQKKKKKTYCRGKKKKKRGEPGSSTRDRSFGTGCGVFLSVAVARPPVQERRKRPRWGKKRGGQGS